MLKVLPQDDNEPRFSLAPAPELSQLQAPDGLEKYIRGCDKRISEFEDQLRKMGEKLGFSDMRVRIGTELEFYVVAGSKSYRKRAQQVLKAERYAEKVRVNALKSGQSKPDADAIYSTAFEEALGKVDTYMPKAAQISSLNKAFRNAVGLTQAKVVRVDAEPAYKTAHEIERRFSKDGKVQFSDPIALFQAELVSPPRSPRGLPLYLAAIAQRVIDAAGRYGLTAKSGFNRAEIVTDLYDMSCSSLHMHVSVMGKREGEWISLMERDTFPEERGTRTRDRSHVSQLGLHIGAAFNEFLRDHVYLFAPTTDAYQRFSPKHFVGTTHIGFSRRKARLDMGSAIFRGAGRRAYREEDERGRPDTENEPLRIELRLPDVGCIGHPNKRAYPDQLRACFDVAEGLLHAVCEGTQRYAESLRVPILEGRTPEQLTEQALYQQWYRLPQTAGEAAKLLLEASRREGSWLSEPRARSIIARGERQQMINECDRRQNLPRGQHHDRRLFLPD
jgi:hypothetical protein